MKKVFMWGAIVGATTLGVAQAQPLPNNADVVERSAAAPISCQEPAQVAGLGTLDWINIGTTVIERVADMVNTSKAQKQQQQEADSEYNVPVKNDDDNINVGKQKAPTADYPRTKKSGASWRDRYEAQASESDVDFWEQNYRYVLNDSMLQEPVEVSDIPSGWLVEGSTWPTSVTGDYGRAFAFVSSDGTCWGFLRQTCDKSVATINGTISKVNIDKIFIALDGYRSEMAKVYGGSCQHSDFSCNAYDLYDVEGLKDDYSSFLDNVVAVKRLGFCQGYVLSGGTRDVDAFLQGHLDLVERKVKGKSVVEIYTVYGLMSVFSDVELVPRRLNQLKKLNRALCRSYYASLPNWNERRQTDLTGAKEKLVQASKYTFKDMQRMVSDIRKGTCRFYTNPLTGSLLSAPNVGADARLWFNASDNFILTTEGVDPNKIESLKSEEWALGEQEKLKNEQEVSRKKSNPEDDDMLRYDDDADTAGGHKPGAGAPPKSRTKPALNSDDDALYDDIPEETPSYNSGRKARTKSGN